MKDELRSVMRPEYIGYNRQVTIPKRGKGKHKASGTSFAPKSKRTPTFKNVNILRFMANSPREFGRSEKDIVCTFFYELTPYCFGDEIMNEIIKIAKQSDVKGHNFTSLAPSDVEFVKCTGKTCRVPQTAIDFEWSTDAVRSLAGQGDIYLRLCKDFEMKNTPSLHGAGRESSAGTVVRSDEDHSNTSTSHSSLQYPVTSAPSTTAVVPVRAASHPTRLSSSETGCAPVQVDLTHASPEHQHSSDDEFPPFPATSEFLPKERLYEIFASQASVAAVDEVLRLCDGVVNSVIHMTDYVHACICSLVM